MPGKKARKTSVKRSRATRTSQVKIVVIFLLLLGIALIARSVMLHENYKVLGASTLLARGGDDSGSGDGGGGSNSGSASSGSSDSGSSGTSGSTGGSNGSGNTSGGSGSGGSDSSGSSTSSGGSSSISVSDNTRVICTGPDGKKFETKRKDCEELNKAWNKPVSFTVLPNKSKSQPVKTETRTRSVAPSVNPSISETPEVENEDDDSGVETKTESNGNEERTEVRLSETERIRTRIKDGRTRIDITSGGIKTRLEVRDDRVVIKAEQEDGTEVELEDDALLKIDDRLAKTVSK